LESNWRWNVADQGMSLTNWRLAARLLEDPEVLMVGIGPADERKYQAWFNATPTDLPTALGPVQVAPGTDGFPYGEAVLPD